MGQARIGGQRRVDAAHYYGDVFSVEGVCNFISAGGCVRCAGYADQVPVVVIGDRLGVFVYDVDLVGVAQGGDYR